MGETKKGVAERLRGYEGADDGCSMERLAKAMGWGAPVCNGVLCVDCYGRIIGKLSEELDAELTAAHDASAREGMVLIAAAEGWPDLHDGESVTEWMARCWLPRPLYEDGEPVQMGDRYLMANGSHDTVSSLSYSKGSVDYVSINGRRRMLSERVKRPATEALGADGNPIVVGETEWNRYGTKNTVERLEYSKSGLVKVWYKNGHFDISCTITHTPPDTQQKIDDDATMPPAEYCAVRGIDLGDDPDRATATEAMVLDLLRRQRAVLARGGE